MTVVCDNHRLVAHIGASPGSRGGLEHPAESKTDLGRPGRGCLVAYGTDSAITALRAEAKKSGAELKIIAPTVEGAKGSDGQSIDADFQLGSGPSVLFDAVVLALSPEAADILSKQPARIGFCSRCVFAFESDRSLRRI